MENKEIYKYLEKKAILFLIAVVVNYFARNTFYLCVHTSLL